MLELDVNDYKYIVENKNNLQDIMVAFDENMRIVFSGCVGSDTSQLDLRGKYLPEVYSDKLVQIVKVMAPGMKPGNVISFPSSFIDPSIAPGRNVEMRLMDNLGSKENIYLINLTQTGDSITAEKASELLMKNEQLFRQLFENSPLGIAMLDEKFDVVRVNKGFTKIFGFEKDEVLHQSLTDLIVPANLKKEASDINKLTSNGEICKIETVRRTKSGKLLNVYIYGLPVFYKRECIGIYGIYVDITAHMVVESELQTRNMELDNFVYKVSHDLRAPLASILGLINLTRLEGSNVDIKKYIDLMENRVNKLDRFISDILSHSKNLKVDVNHTIVNFRDIIENGFRELDYLKGTKNIKTEVSISKGNFISDQWRIGEIFRNLISNAIKYSDPDKSENRIKIDIEILDDGANICFEDQGIGIPESSLSAIFDMFYRATESSDGSGIGLYIVKNAIDKLGGSIKIHSKEGEGTRFDIKIPSLI